VAELSPEASKLKAARESAIEELREIDGKQRSVSDHDVRRLSGARMLCDSLTLRMLSGDSVSPAEFKAANELVDQARHIAGHREIDVEIVWAENVIGLARCPHCHAKFEVSDYVAPPMPERPARTIDVDVVTAATLPAPKDTQPPTAPKALPYHLTHAKDSRPNAPSPAPVNGGEGSLCWVGGAGTFNPFGFER
jgi:hypothetical protein